MFFLSEDQMLIQNMARSFVSEKITPFAREWEKAEQIPQSILSEMGALGLMGMTVAETYGGSATDYVSYALALIEVAAGDGGLSTIMSVTNAPVGAAIEALGSEDQKKRFLKPLARGEMLGAFCLTEPQAGSDASALKTKAVRQSGSAHKNGWRLNGTKQFVTSGRLAGIALVFAVTDPTKGKKGISAFLVPTDTKGYIVANIEKKLGQKSSDTCQIIFDNCDIDQSMMLGSEGGGYKIALSNLEAGRIGIAAQSVGMARAAFDFACDYASGRISFGKPLASHQAIGFRLADMATKLEAATLLTLSAAAKKDSGAACLKEACMAKLFASEVAEEICSKSLQVLGGYGYLEDYPIEKIYRDVKVCQIYEGTSDIQRLIISRELAKN